MKKIQESEIVYKYTQLINNDIFSGQEFELLRNYMALRRKCRESTAPSRVDRLKECMETAAEKIYYFYHPEERPCRVSRTSYSYRPPKRRWEYYGRYDADGYPRSREVLCAFRN